ncbi:hypothetical protein BH10PSE1_BH10PSE1_10380 [soil metagenome]
MKSSLAVVAVVMTVAIAGCDRRAAAPVEAPASSAANVAIPPVPTTERVAPSTPGATAIAADAPDFAAVYPEADVQGDPLIATSDAGPGGIVTFTTDASPDAVIAFYRQKAEAAGLAMIMSLNTGDARAYGAQKQANGARVEVIASPVEDRTSVQLTWSAGR